MSKETQIIALKALIGSPAIVSGEIGKLAAQVTLLAEILLLNIEGGKDDA